MKYPAVFVLILVCAVTLAPAGCAVETETQKAVLVTGASSGIGRNIAERLAREGFFVYAGARKKRDLDELDAVPNIKAVRLDVTVQDDIDAARRLVESEGRGLWGIVNNAGVIAYSTLASGPETDVLFTFDVNVFGPFRINQAFLPLVRESGGRTTTIGSVAGFIAGARSGHYAMSKFAMEAYTDALAAELADTGVHVSIVEPGAYRSRIRQSAAQRALAVAEAEGRELSEDERARLQRLEERNARMTEPDAVSAAVLDVMTNPAPKRRYLVTPNPNGAENALRHAFRRVAELNHDHDYSRSRDDLVTMLDEALDAL